MSFDPAEPFKVVVQFSRSGGEPVSWVLSRELLASGLVRPAGEADVFIWPPCLRHSGVHLHLMLIGPDHAARLDADFRAVKAWLDQTYIIVSASEEWSKIDWDSTVRHIQSE
ncbi:SsgA family sporulation/cell division regulator [Streptomyces sp. NPDC090080]|uniref:SsgA family sporulation/cell division regulator n=1 Tax=Streptomyces sp. NPDC090080 TaxID=3365939 RepID=UPI0038037EC5